MHHGSAPRFSIKLLAPSGLDFGEGTISAAEHSNEPGNIGLAASVDACLHQPDILLPLSMTATGTPVTDDGCGDGRAAMPGDLYTTRPKVFGGGATMAMAMLVGNGSAAGKPLNEVFLAAETLLDEHGVNYGGHTGAHFRKDTVHSGCGAIDAAPKILAAATTYQDQIKTVIGQHLQLKTDGLDDIIKHFAQSADQPDYKGTAVIEQLRKHGKVVKELDGYHHEMAIVLNFVSGYTVDQAKVRSATDERAQVFAVDVWRIKQLAERLHDTAEQQRIGLLAELVYTLATAAILTKGDLPVYVLNEL